MGRKNRRKRENKKKAREVKEAKEDLKPKLEKAPVTQNTKKEQNEIVNYRRDEEITSEENSCDLEEEKSDEEDNSDKADKSDRELLGFTKETQLSTQEDSIKRYDKRPGSATVHGVYYEVKMCMLVFLRLLNLKANFSLCSNLNEIGTFDDVVAHYRYNNENAVRGRKHKVKNGFNNEAIFIQLKHTVIDDKIMSISFHKGSPDIKLLDYFLSFLLCDNHVDYDDEIFASDPKKRLYLIFTNANVDMTLLVEDTSFSSILNGIIQGKVFKLKQSELYKIFSKFLESIHNIFYGSLKSQIKAAKEINELINTKQFMGKGGKQNSIPSNGSLEELKISFCKHKDINTKKIKDFFSKMRICCCQVNVNSVDKNIKHEIQNSLTVSKVETKTVFTKLQKKFISWHDNESYYLTQNSKIWTDISKETRDVRLKNMEMRNLRLMFNDESVSSTIQEIRQFSILKIVSGGESTTLSTLKTWQALESFIPESYLLVSVKECTKHSNDLWDAWPSRWCKTLVIEFDAVHEDVQMITEKLTKEIKNNPSAQVIFICPQSSTFKTEHMKDITDNVNFRQLEKQSKEQILRSSKINFQGLNVSLNSVLKEKHIEMLGTDQLSNLVMSELTIGKDIFEYDQKGYISRNILVPYLSDKIFYIQEKDTVVAIKLSNNSKRLNVSGNCLSYTNSDNFLIEINCNIYSVPELKELHKENMLICSDTFYVLLRDNEEFKTLCDIFPNAHRIEECSEFLVWKETKGKISTIKNCLDYGSYVVCEEDFLKINLQNPVIIYGKPGMGKTALLKHTALILKQNCPNKWIIFIQLAHYCNFFRNCCEMTREKMLEVIIKSEDLKVDVSFFNENSEILKDFIILLDAFDEVCPYYIDKAEKLLDYLIESSYFVYITCRKGYRSHLEEKFGNFSCKIQPLNQEMKEKILLQSWKEKRVHLTEDALRNFTQSIIIFFSPDWNNSRLASAQIHFTDNPSNLLMLSEIYDEKYVELDTNGKVTSGLNIFQMFTEYLQKKCERFHGEKTGCDTSNPSAMEKIKIFVAEIIECNKIISASQVFHGELPAEGKEYKESKMFQNALNDSKNVGIIERITDNGFVTYTHKLFEMYFAALWLASSFMQNESLVTKIMFGQGFGIVGHFFDLKCSESCVLHTAIITKDVNCIKNYLRDNSSLSDIFDVMGRTALHLSVLNNDNHITKLLPVNYADTSIRDKLGLTPIDYIVCAYSWESMNPLLENIQFTEEESYELWRKVEIHQNEIIFRCCENGLIELLKFVSKYVDLKNSFLMPHEYKKRNSRFLFDYLFFSKMFYPMYVAAEFGQVNTVKLLQKYKCDINFINELGYTLLHIASCKGHTELVKYLISEGLDVNCCSFEKSFKETPLHMAVREGSKEVIEELLKNNASLDDEDVYHMTPLLKACKRGDIEIVKYLVDCNANIKQCDISGNNPALVALLHRQVDIFKYLVSIGVDINYENKNGHTAFHFAYNYVDTELMKFCEDYGAKWSYVDSNFFHWVNFRQYMDDS